MSGKIQFTSTDEAKRWLETQTSSTLKPVHAQAKKLCDDLAKALEAVEEISKYLFDVSFKEIERRNMKVYNRARALNKLARLFIDRFKKIDSPQQVSYDIVSNYALETQKVFQVTDIDINNWFPRISPFFIMDRRKFSSVYDKSKQAYNALNNFVTNEYVKTKTLEETFQLLSELQSLEKQSIALKDDKDNIKNERASIDQNIIGMEQRINELKNQGPIDHLNAVNTQIETLNNELKNEVRHLQKPFIKMQSLATSGGGGGVTPDELKELNQYLEKPFDAFIAEQNGYPLLKEILEKLGRLLTEDALKLKAEKARKAEQTVNEILQKDSLVNLQGKCKEVAAKRDQLVASSQLGEIKQSLTQLQEQVNQLKARKTSVETQETLKVNAHNEAVGKISNLKRTIERKIHDSTDATVQIA